MNLRVKLSLTEDRLGIPHPLNRNRPLSVFLCIIELAFTPTDDVCHSAGLGFKGGAHSCRAECSFRGEKKP